MRKGPKKGALAVEDALDLVVGDLVDGTEVLLDLRRASEATDHAVAPAGTAQERSDGRLPGLGLPQSEKDALQLLDVVEALVEDLPDVRNEVRPLDDHSRLGCRGDRRAAALAALLLAANCSCHVAHLPGTENLGYSVSATQPKRKINYTPLVASL